MNPKATRAPLDENKICGIYFDPKKDAYKVDITRCQRRFQKSFSVEYWGGQALELAKQWKSGIDHKVSADPPARKRKPSQVKGVYFDVRRNCWTGCIQLDYTRCKKEFSLVQFEDDEAHSKALAWRKLMEGVKRQTTVCKK